MRPKHKKKKSFDLIKTSFIARHVFFISSLTSSIAILFVYYFPIGRRILDFKSKSRFSIIKLVAVKLKTFIIKIRKTCTQKIILFIIKHL